MSRQYILSEVWTEIISVVDDNMIVDSSFNMHFYEVRNPLLPGYYIALRKIEDGAVESYLSDCHLIGPFPRKAAADLLRSSVLYFGGADLRQFVHTRLRRFSNMPVVSPALMAQRYYPALSNQAR
jgi:hypothetical protein